MPSVILTTQPASTLSVVPNQNTTFTVAASADFPTISYTYQWKKAADGGAIESATNIAGAVNATYFFEPASGDDGFKYYCTVNALSATSSGPASQASVNSAGVALTVNASTTEIYHKWVPKSNDPNPLKESGAERFRRMHNLGYC